MCAIVVESDSWRSLGRSYSDWYDHEPARGAIHRETRRDTLYSGIPRHLHNALDDYLGNTTAFDYVQFSQVFDMRQCQLNYREILAKGRFQDPCAPWCNGLLTVKTQTTSSMVSLRDFLATHGVVRISPDGVDVE